MRCKIFFGRNREALQKAVNEWLETHLVDIQHTQFSQVLFEDEVQYVVDSTLILFYIPRVDEGVK